MSEKARTKPPQRHSRPATSRTNEPSGVRLPNALARRKRGNASCSRALKMYTFCSWNKSGIKGEASAEEMGKLCNRNEGLTVRVTLETRGRVHSRQVNLTLSPRQQVTQVNPLCTLHQRGFFYRPVSGDDRRRSDFTVLPPISKAHPTAAGRWRGAGPVLGRLACSKGSISRRGSQ